MTPTDKPMTVDALIENTRDAWYMGQTYLLETSRAAIERPEREAAGLDQEPANRVPNPDHVICPKCTHQFRAIPENVQAALAAGRGSGEPVAVEPIIDAYLDDYETAHDEGSSAPDADTKFVIKDAIMGLLADDEFVKAVTPQPREPLTEDQERTDRVLAHARAVHETSEHMHARNDELRLMLSDMSSLMLRMVAGIEHLAEIARQWEPDHSSGADRRGWLLAQDAKDDAKKLLAELPGRIHRPNDKVSGVPPQD